MTHIRISQKTYDRVEAIRVYLARTRGRFQTKEDALVELLDGWEQKEAGVKP